MMKGIFLPGARRLLARSKKATLSERMCYSLRAITLIAPEPPPRHQVTHCFNSTKVPKYQNENRFVSTVLYHYTIIPFGFFIFAVEAGRRRADGRKKRLQIVT